MQHRRTRGFIQIPYVLGEIESIGGGSVGCAPNGVQGQSPLSRALQKLEVFCCITSLFFYILEGIVEL